MLINLAAFVIVIAGIMSAKAIVVPFLLASFLAIICAPPVYWLRTRKVPPIVSSCWCWWSFWWKWCWQPW